METQNQLQPGYGQPAALFPKQQGGKPTIMQVAIDKTEEYKDSANEENPDIYFLLTDVDHFENFLHDFPSQRGGQHHDKENQRERDDMD